MKKQVMGLALIGFTGVTSLCNIAVGGDFTFTVPAGEGAGQWEIKQSHQYEITVSNNYVSDNSTEPALMRVKIKNTMTDKWLHQVVLRIIEVTGSNPEGQAEFVQNVGGGKWEKIPTDKLSWTIGDIKPGNVWSISLYVLTFPFTPEEKMINRYIQRLIAEQLELASPPDDWSYSINPILGVKEEMGNPRDKIYSCYGGPDPACNMKIQTRKLSVRQHLAEGGSSHVGWVSGNNWGQSKINFARKGKRGDKKIDN